MKRFAKYGTAAAVAAAAVKQAQERGYDQRAAEMAERVRKSDAYEAIQETGGKWSSRAQEKIHEAGLDTRAAELRDRIRDADATRKAKEAAERMSDDALAGLGAWMAKGERGRKLGVRSAKRRFAFIPLAIGAGLGWGIGVLTAPRPGTKTREELAQRAQEMRQEAATRMERMRQQTVEVAHDQLEEMVRARLSQDPRTSQLGALNVDVAEGTVFVRGEVPQAFDERQIREIVLDVPGVRDVDLQVTTIS
ncbi:MAG TPA: BON domain-containing protein [Egibacteraceae bacterium]|nr:BON domain-containing protein [Egibacteraceae bacterium]